MSAHTPGPWALRGYQIRAENGLGKHVATYQVGEADGRLIAAAPELLEALKEVAAGRLDHEHGLDDFHDRARAIARAAIAKAEGA